jgi:hypothetical protein
MVSGHPASFIIFASLREIIFASLRETLRLRVKLKMDYFEPFVLLCAQRRTAMEKFRTALKTTAATAQGCRVNQNPFENRVNSYRGY